MSLVTLPGDILVCIALNLPLPDLANLARVARLFQICLSEKLWKQLCQKRFPKYCPRELPDNLSYAQLFRELDQTHQLKGNRDYTVFNDKEPQFYYDYISLIYPVPIFVVCGGGHSIFTDIYIERIIGLPFLIVSQSKRDTILQCQVPSVGSNIPRAKLGCVPASDRYESKLRLHNIFLPLNELIHQDYLPQLLAEAKEKGYLNVVEAAGAYPTVRAAHLIKYKSLFYFTGIIPE